VRHLSYVLSLTRFAFRANRLLYVSIAISLLSAGIELIAMSSLMPLFELVSGGPPSTKSLVARAIATMGFYVSAEALLWAFIALFSLRIITQLIGQSLSTYLGKRVLAQLCSGAFGQIIHRLSIREVTDKSIGFYISLAGDESFRASTLVLSLAQFVSTASLAAFYFAAIAIYSPAAATFVAVFLVCSLIAMIRIVRLSHRLGAQQTTESRKAGSLFLDALNNIKAVRGFSAEHYVVGMHRVLMFGYSRILFWVDELALLTRLVPVLLLLLFFSIWLVTNSQRIENIGIAFVVTMIVYLMRFFPVVGQGVTLLLKIASDAKSGRDVTAIVDARAAGAGASTRALGRIEEVDLRNVSFRYDDAVGKMVLRDLSVKFERGRSYALVGKSGLGKSTLVDILLKFYEPSAGQLRLNGFLISEFIDSEIRKRIILVSQEAAIFEDTVRNNVCLGIDAQLADVQVACSLACIHEVIEAMPEGYETRLLYRGTNLSGGQRQRIAIARALLRKPDVLILDEGTSALDKVTQERVVQNILRAYSENIVIFVTHDPSIMEQLGSIVDLEALYSGGVSASDSSALLGLTS
jgi:ABC-type bacteriocin/lantibiotic exporter with double-glycine peptidase domain